MCGTPLQDHGAPVAPLLPLAGGALVACPACSRTTAAAQPYCQHCGAHLALAAAATAPPLPSSETVRLETVPPPPAPGSAPGPEARPLAAAARPRLVVQADGRDLGVHYLTGDTFDIGRTEGQLVIGDDPHLAPRHARLLSSGGTVRVRPLDTVNGVYLRLREPQDLVPGDQLLLGRQLLRFESVPDEERQPPPVVEHGVRLLGSALKDAWGRLRQLTAAGTSRDVWHLSGDELSVGGSGSDVVLDDDEVLPHHLLLHRSGGRTRVEDTGGSVGGTFLRVRGERELRHRDLLRLGDQLVRFENVS
jgi:pSer/pThr/pTyr-binding forkhead associated (FHA) protein